jgi:hypothetical protein
MEGGEKTGPKSNNHRPQTQGTGELRQAPQPVSKSNNPSYLNMSWRDNVPFGYDWWCDRPEEDEEWSREPESPRSGRWEAGLGWTGLMSWRAAAPWTFADETVADAMRVCARIYAAKHSVEMPAGFNRRGYYREEQHRLSLMREEVEIRKVPISLAQFYNVAAGVEQDVRIHCAKVERAIQRGQIDDPAYTVQIHDEEFYNRLAHSSYYRGSMRVKFILWHFMAKLVFLLRRVRHAKWMPGGAGHTALLGGPTAKTLCGKRVRED